MTRDEFIQIIGLGREQNGVEFKSAGLRTDKQLLARVIRAAIGMSNRRYGGIVIVGINEDGEGNPVLVGLNPTELKSWKYDDFSDSLSSYADPSITFMTEEFEFESKTFLVVNIDEFGDIPIICKRDFPGVLRQGAVYVRTRRKPETSDIPTHEDMRQLLDLAVEKRLRQFTRTASAVGLSLERERDQSDEDQFNRQLGEIK